jgi:uncharacterized lipoprotein YajG
LKQRAEFKLFTHSIFHPKMKKLSLLLGFCAAFALLPACKKETCKSCTVSQTITQTGQPTVTQTSTGSFCGDDLENIEKNGNRLVTSTSDGAGGAITTDQRYNCQ